MPNQSDEATLLVLELDGLFFVQARNKEGAFRNDQYFYPTKELAIKRLHEIQSETRKRLNQAGCVMRAEPLVLPEPDEEVPNSQLDSEKPASRDYSPEGL